MSNKRIRVHLMLDAEHYSRLRAYFASSISISEAIRIAIERFLNDHEALARQIIDKPKKD